MQKSIQPSHIEVSLAIPPCGYCTMPLMTLRITESMHCLVCTNLVVWCLVLHGRVSGVVLVLVRCRISAPDAMQHTHMLLEIHANLLP
jgi:hypothetical protein